MKIRDVKCASAMSEEELPGPDFLPCRAMTKQEVEDQIDLWASAAERAWKAGFDACEINHATAHQGNTSCRVSGTSGRMSTGPQSYENRTRFIREHHRRGEAGAAAPASRSTPLSTPPNTITRVRPPWKRAWRSPSSSARWADGPERARRALRASWWHLAAGPPHVPRAALRPAQRSRLEPPGRRRDGALAEAVQAGAAVKVPVWTACRIDAEWGEKYLSDGRLDFVGMTRFLLADPEYPNKVREGRLADVRPVAWAACTASRCEPQQEAGVPGQRRPGPGDHPGIPGEAGRAA